MDIRSGFSFWLIKNGLPSTYPKLETSTRSDTVILGGGISGALAGYQLAREGVECLLIDARTIGLGSTCASTSLLQYEIDKPLCHLITSSGYKNATRAYRLCLEAIDKLAEIAETIGFSDFQHKKSLFYAAHKNDEAFIKKEFEARKAAGFVVQYLDKTDIKNAYGFSAAGAILSKKAATTDAYAFTHALHRFSLSKGLRIFDRTKITKIRSTRRGHTLLTEDGHSIKTKRLVFATGYEVVNFIDKKIVDLKSTYATISEQFNDGTAFWKDECLIWNTAHPYLYLRTTSDRRILIGGRDENFFEPVRRDKLIKRKTAQLTKDFQRIFPQIKFNAEFSWAGTFGSTKDGLPYIGTYSKKPNSYFALGFGGNGITFSQIAAEIIADLIRGKKNADADIFSFDR